MGEKEINKHRLSGERSPQPRMRRKPVFCCRNGVIDGFGRGFTYSLQNSLVLIPPMSNPIDYPFFFFFGKRGMSQGSMPIWKASFLVKGNSLKGLKFRWNVDSFWSVARDLGRVVSSFLVTKRSLSSCKPLKSSGKEVRWLKPKNSFFRL